MSSVPGEYKNVAAIKLTSIRKAIADHLGALLSGLIMDVLLRSASNRALAQIGF
jgi:hypothetical protein